MSSISDRVKWARVISTQVQTHYTPSLSCRTLWDRLFDQRKKYAGGGQYGDVWIVNLKSHPSYSLVVKKTKRIELAEVKQTLLAGALVEVGANPHFNILYAHVHCEDDDYTKYFSRKKRNLSWTEGEVLLQRLALQLRDHPEQRPAIQKQMIDIDARMYPAMQELKKIKLLKDNKERLVNDMYATVGPYYREDPDAMRDLELLNALNQTYRHMQEIRAQYYSAYELILMERSEGKFDDIMKKASVQGLISAIFQACMGFLSYVSFFGLVQNDMHLGNIMYNHVHPDVYYVYKVGELYFRVPLYGKLIKIIDFGLSTDVKTFYKPTQPGKPPTHWCPGGRGVGKEDQLQCSVYLRDTIELFYNLQTEIGVRHSLRPWLQYVHKKTQSVVQGNVKTLFSILVEVFHESTLKRFGLPSVIQMVRTPPSLQYQTEPFEVIHRKKYIRKINDVLAAKLWNA